MIEIIDPFVKKAKLKKNNFVKNCLKNKKLINT